MEKSEIKNIVECLLFVSSKPLKPDKLAKIAEASINEIEETLQEISLEYSSGNRPVFIQEVAGGVRIASRQKYGPYVKKLFEGRLTYNLSTAALETLAIIAYRQPVTMQDIEQIRGVSSSGVVRGLLEKRLVKLAGRKEALGRPILYRTSEEFLEYFGLQSLSDIPPLEELGIEEEVEELAADRQEEESHAEVAEKDERNTQKN